MNMSTAEDEKWFDVLTQNNMRPKWICKFQFFDRDKNTWSEMISPQVGFSETFRQDEETDEASLNFIWKDKERPNLKHMQWCRILHFYDGDDFKATYDSEGLPLNHNQYVLGDFQMSQSKDQSYWLVKMSLLEPIERAKFVVGETLAFTNQISKTVTDGSGNTVTYVKEPYNHLTALERFLKVTPANCDNYDEGYNPHENKSWFNRISILDKDFLKNIPFDSDSFTEPDLYTVLFKYDKTTGRTPCLYFDIDPETDLPRNLERDEYLLKFLRQDGYDKPVLDLEEVLANAQNVSYKSSLANFATGVVSNVSNLVAGSRVQYPAQNLYAVAELISDARNCSSANKANSGWGLRLPYPIKKINSLKKVGILTYFTSAETMCRVVRVNSEELVDNVYEIQQYNALSDEDYERNDLYFFTEGDNILYTKESYFRDSIQLAAVDVSDKLFYIYKIEYEPLLNVRLLFGESEFASIYNQVDSQVESTKYYNYLSSYLKSMNKADLTISIKHFHPNQMYDLGSMVTDKTNSKKFMITKIAYQNINNEMLAVYQLNENHFRRSLSVKASKVIRHNMAIDYNNLKDRKTCINHSIQLSLHPVVSSVFQFNSKLIFYPFFKDAILPQLAILKMSNNLTAENNEKYYWNKNVIFPIARYNLGTQLIFQILMPNNTYAGHIKKMQDYVRVINMNNYHSFTANVESQIPVIYADCFGEVDKLDISLTYLDNIEYSDYNDEDLYRHEEIKKEYDRTVDLVACSASFPEVDEQIESKLMENRLLEIKNVIYKKDMLERLNIAICFELVSAEEDLIVCDNFFSHANLDLSVKFYDTIKNKYDDLSSPSKILNCNAKSLENGIRLNFVEQIPQNSKSAVIFNEETPLIIINKINDHIDANNNLNIYY